MFRNSLWLKRVLWLLVVLSGFLLPLPTYASAIYALGVGLTVDASTSDAVAAAITYYDLDGTTNTRFLPTSLGASINTDQGGTLLLAGGNGKTWQAPADVAQNLNLFYRVFETGTAAASRPVFSSYNLIYQNQWTSNGDINKYWASTSSPGNVNLLTGLTAGTIDTPKNYTIEFYGSSYMTYTGGNFTAYDNNGGNNYTTSFQLVPEPSIASLLTLSIVGAIMQRRRRS